MEHHVVTEKLFMPLGTIQVSQAIPNNGEASAIYIDTWIESGGTITIGDLDIWVQESFDLDTWKTNTNITGGSITLAPGKVSFGTPYVGYGSVKAPFIRLLYDNNTSIDMIIGAEIRLFRL